MILRSGNTTKHDYIIVMALINYIDKNIFNKVLVYRNNIGDNSIYFKINRNDYYLSKELKTFPINKSNLVYLTDSKEGVNIYLYIFNKTESNINKLLKNSNFNVVHFKNIVKYTLVDNNVHLLNNQVKSLLNNYYDKTYNKCLECGDSCYINEQLCGKRFCCNMYLLQM